MKIGILTLPLHINYGGILQAWALQTVLTRMHHRVEVFGLNPKSSHSNYELPLVWLVRMIRRVQGTSNVPIFSEIKEQKYKKRRFGDIKRFISDKINTKIINGLNAIPESSYDLIIVGSDQIWRKEYIAAGWCSNNPAEAFLSALKHHGVDRIAYAASFGVESWNFSEAETVEIKTALSRFKNVSVRENSAVDLLDKSVGVSASFVLDPTMLLKPEDYIECFGIHKEPSKSKLVSYILDPNAESEQLISKIAVTRGLEKKEINLLHSCEKLISIEEWVKSIANAEIVVTDSFHGCVFSIIFNKPLIFICNESRGNARFASLISTFGIKKNCLESIADYDPEKTYCLPENIQSKLEQMRNHSISWLSESLKQ